MTVTLPTAAFRTAWEMLDLGEPHPIVGAPHVWADVEARRELHVATMDLLTDLGLAHNRLPSPRWRATLQVIGQAEREYYAWSGLREGTRRAALVAQREQDAVLVRVLDDGTTEIRPVPPARLATTLFDTLPDAPAAAIKAVSVPPPSDDAPDPFAEEGQEQLTAVLSRPQEAVHQLYVARREGGRRTSGGPITAVDLDLGRVLTYVTVDGSVELVPGSPRAVVKILNDTWAAL
ncbi:ESX secretion-associated protein EspG [Amycolatopsis jejuensis]|uniref:ESX secretion-associated protein EspG n=1 Tax=Amycolatopsis jejuensis TaxID=330084 RepID=UPI0005271428|nr:ESX secretion-associated protein EspG [Amycolatopsis jejuensis]